jgi:hypothetical protein
VTFFHIENQAFTAFSALAGRFWPESSRIRLLGRDFARFLPFGDIFGQN